MTQEPELSRAEVLAAMQQGYTEFTTYLATLSPAQLTVLTDAGGWTIKDHVMHLAVWEDGMNALFERRPRAEAMGVEPALFASGDWDAVNAVIQRRWQQLSWPEVTAAFQQAHERLIAKIQALSDEALQRPYNYYQPAATWDRPVITTLIGNTSAHYAEHRPWIEAIAQSIPTKAGLLAALQTGWTQLNAYLDTLSEAQASIPADAGGWTVKDHVIHLALWEGSMNAVLERRPRQEYLGVDRETWASGDIERINDVMFRQNRERTWADVRQAFRQMHAELVAHVTALADEDMQRPYNYYQPESTQTLAIGVRLTIATYYHYAEHQPWIEAIVGSAAT